MRGVFLCYFLQWYFVGEWDLLAVLVLDACELKRALSERVLRWRHMTCLDPNRKLRWILQRLPDSFPRSQKILQGLNTAYGIAIPLISESYPLQVCAVGVCNWIPVRSLVPRTGDGRPEETRARAEPNASQNTLWLSPLPLSTTLELHSKDVHWCKSQVLGCVKSMHHSFFFFVHPSLILKLTSGCGLWWGHTPSCCCWAWQSARLLSCAWRGCCSQLRTPVGGALHLRFLSYMPNKANNDKHESTDW